MRTVLPPLAQEHELLRALALPAFPAEIRAQAPDVLQLNLGKLCNQTCAHCHVDAGPLRREQMSARTIQLALALIERERIPRVDLTGGAPELHPQFEELVRSARRLGAVIMDRCNLTVLSLPRSEHLPDFLAEQRVQVVASLPHYRPSLTDRQRGDGVHEQSIDGLKRLNAVGYGRAGSGLELTLVSNPVGAFLSSSSQAALEGEWKRELKRLHGIEFTRLFLINNMPIRRFLYWLEESGNLAGYMQRLVQAYNPATLEGLMCRTTLSVAWDGSLHDCDFNQMLELGLAPGAPRTLSEYERTRAVGRRVLTGPHCYGCTAGAGSSCGGVLTG